MDKKTLIGVVLIALLMFVWMFYMGSTQQSVPPEQKKNADKQKVETVSEEKEEESAIKPILNLEEKYGKYFSKFTTDAEQHIEIETDYYKAIISNKGAAIVRWTLKDYNKWDGVPVQLINYENYELFMRFITTEAKKIDTRDLFFSDKNLEKNIKLTGDASKEITYDLDLGDGQIITKKITFYGNKYHIEQDITVSNLDGILKGGYSLVWGNNLNYQEYNSVSESENSQTIISMNGSVETFDASETEIEDESYTGIIDYVAVKTKYFTAAIIPQPWQGFDSHASFAGYYKNVKKNGKVEYYEMDLRVPYKGGKQTNSFQVFIGPVKYDIVRKYGLEATVNFGWKFIRPIGEYLISPLFNLIYRLVSNYGIALILFALIMKILLYPLSITQMRSASKMQLLAPEMTKIREKYKDDMQKQQAETMKLYQEYGINPAGGCLPMLIQFPILISLWQVLQNNIDLRQQDFILWITDLSMPDKIVSWDFSFLGLSHISGLAVAMSLAMFFQQKMTITDPRQKGMLYIFPIMFLLIFSNLPSGLNLYYFTFNLLGIAQQIYINKFSRNKMTLEDMKRQPKKESWLQRKMQEAQEIAAAQGKLPPNFKKVEQNKNINKSRNKNYKRRK